MLQEPVGRANSSITDNCDGRPRPTPIHRDHSNAVRNHRQEYECPKPPDASSMLQMFTDAQMS